MKNLNTLIGRQHGAITRTQALTHGLTARMIDWRVRTGAWTIAAPKTYVVSSSPDTWERQVVVAVLASGEVQSPRISQLPPSGGWSTIGQR